MKRGMEAALEKLHRGVVFVMLFVGVSAPLRAEMSPDQKADQLLKQSERFQMGGYLQTQYSMDQSEGIPSGTGNNGLFFRRGELTSKGQLLDNLFFVIGFEVTGSTDPLRDAYVDWTAIPMAAARLGQFRIPFGIEMQSSSKKLYLIDRMLVAYPNNEQPSSKLVTSVKSGYLQERDMGLRLSGKPLTGPVGVDYAVAIINGSDKNTPDKNDKKDLAGRVGISPLKMLTVGGSIYRGRSPQTVTAGGATTFTGINVKRDRYGADLELHPIEPLVVRAEYVTGKNDATRFNGYYALIAYRLPIDVEPAIRFERLDPDKDKSNNEITRTTLGINYYIKGDIKLQVNQEFREDKAAPKIGNMTLAQLQISF